MLVERGMQLFVDVEMEAYGDQAAVTGNQFFCKSREEPSREHCDVNMSGTSKSERGHLILSNLVYKVFNSSFNFRYVDNYHIFP